MCYCRGNQKETETTATANPDRTSFSNTLSGYYGATHYSKGEILIHQMAYPTTDQKTERIAKFVVEEIVPCFGVPRN